MSKVYFSSLRDDWKTPKKFYEELDKEFDFDFDPCPTHPNYDGLFIEWGERNFVNPPYRHWQLWVEKGYEEWKKGKTIVFLLAARTDTKAFHDYILPYASEIRFIKGRLKFDEHKNAAPFPSMVVVFKHEQ
jgi:site-specific DNA-methyltransferase (adenine-specific)